MVETFEPTMDQTTKHVSMNLPSDLHIRMRVYAIATGQAVRDVYQAAAEEYLARVDHGSGPEHPDSEDS